MLFYINMINGVYMNIEKEEVNIAVIAGISQVADEIHVGGLDTDGIKDILLKCFNKVEKDMGPAEIFIYYMNSEECLRNELKIRHLPDYSRSFGSSIMIELKDLNVAVADLFNKYFK